MRINKLSLNENEKISHKAAINKSAKWFAYKHLAENKDSGLNCDTALRLLNKIDDALAHHPSKEIINIKPVNKIYDPNSACTVVSSTKASFYDIEPAGRSDLGLFMGTIRRILAPQNKVIFQLLTGSEHNKQYQTWWDKHFATVWQEINNLFQKEDKTGIKNDSFYDDCLKGQINQKHYNKI